MLQTSWLKNIIIATTVLLFSDLAAAFDKDKTAAAISTIQVTTIMGTTAAKILNNSAQRIRSNTAGIKADKIEASGILWQAKENHFLLISDERYKSQSTIFIMDEQGIITSRLLMKDLNFDDLESISSDEEYTYVLSSLSHTKKDKLKAKRKKFIRFKYQNNKVTEQQGIDLYHQLKLITEKQPETELSSFLTQAIDEHSMDIESHFVKDNQLYLGFKSPFKKNKTLILKINNFRTLFKGENASAEIWNTFDLLEPDTKEPMQLSDMLLVDQQLFLLGVSSTSIKHSTLWQYPLENGPLTEIARFPGLKAEGLSYQPKKSLFTIVFDEGKKVHSKYISFALAK